MTPLVHVEPAAAPPATRSPGRAFAWLLLATAGQVLTLRLVDAGPLLHYQHYPPLPVLAATHPLALAFLFGQFVLVIAGLGRAGLTLGTGRTRVRLGVALALATCTAAAVSPSPLRFAAELLFAATLQLLALATLVLAAASLPGHMVTRAGRFFSRLVGPDEEPASPIGVRGDRFAWTAGAFATVVAGTLAYVAYERHPHVPDEVVYLLHARYFAQGLFTMPLPPVPAGFDLDLMTFEPTRWFSPVPPGWPAALSVGAWFGVPWLVNPVLAGLNVVLVSVVFSHLYSRRVTRYATALLAVSPWHLFLGMSLMTHIFTLTSVLLAALGVVRSRATGSWRWALVAGTGVGLTSLIRPLDGAMVGLLIAAWSFGVGGTRLTLASILALGVSTAATGALAFPYNRALTGDPLTFPINAYVDSHYHRNSNAYGFGPDRGMGWALDPNPGHGPVDAVINTNLNMFGINTDLFGWSTGSLVLVALFLCFGRVSRSDRLMLATILTILTGYFFYYYSGGPDFAARYWFPVILPFVALSARGLSWLENRVGPRAPLAVAALVAAALSTFVPWRAMDKYLGFRGMRPGVRALASQYGFAHDLVLVRGDRHPDYASAAAENPIDLRSDPATIYAWDRSADVRAAVVAAYPDRRVWVIEGPSLSGRGYRLVAGPLAPGTVPSADPAR